MVRHFWLELVTSSWRVVVNHGIDEPVRGVQRLKEVVLRV
jgi:hypothetical protein